MSAHVAKCAAESAECLQRVCRRPALKMSSRSAVEFSCSRHRDRLRAANLTRRKSVDFGDEFPMLGTEMAEVRARDASPSPGERRRMSLGCERSAKSRKVDALKVPSVRERKESVVAASSPMILMSGLGELRLSDQNNNHDKNDDDYDEAVSGCCGEEPKTPPPPPSSARLEMATLFGEMKRRNVSVGSEDDDEREIDISEAEKRRHELLGNMSLVHFIRSPTDGVFLPIFKKKIDESVAHAKEIGEKIDDETKCGKNSTISEADKLVNANVN
jgi:hypothetical protein